MPLPLFIDIYMKDYLKFIIKITSLDVQSRTNKNKLKTHTFFIHTTKPSI